MNKTRLELQGEVKGRTVRTFINSEVNEIVIDLELIYKNPQWSSTPLGVLIIIINNRVIVST